MKFAGRIMGLAASLAFVGLAAQAQQPQVPVNSLGQAEVSQPSGLQLQASYGASSLVLKTSAGGYVYSISGSVGATAAFIMLFSATAAPSNGAVAAPTLQGCWGPFSANLPFSLSWFPNPAAEVPNPGITVMASSTGCATLTALAVTSLVGGVY